MEESLTMIDSKEKFILEILEEQIKMLSAVSKNNGFKCNCQGAWIWHTLQIINVDVRYFQNSIISTLRYGQLKRFNCGDRPDGKKMDIYQINSQIFRQWD